MHRILFATVFLSTFSCARSAPQPLAFIHVTVIDGTGAPAQPDMTVVMAGGRITAIGKSAAFPVPNGAKVVDSTGKFFIPGLCDMHGHLTDATQTALALLIMHGVTGVRDMGGDLDQIDRWRDEIARGQRVGPHIVRAGPFVDGPKPGAKYRLTVTNAEDGRRAPLRDCTDKR